MDLLKNRKTVYGLSAVVAILIIIGIIFGFNHYKIVKLEAQAQSYYSNEDYDKAKEVYQQLADKTGSQKYTAKLTEVNKDIEAQAKIKKAEAFIDSKMYYEALSILTRMSKEDSKFADKIDDDINQAIPGIKRELEEYINNMDYKKAVKAADDYLLLLPGNKSIADIKETANKSAGSSSSGDSTKVVYVQSGGSSGGGSSEMARMNSLANRVLNTTQTITSSEANVRSGPSKSSSAIRTLYAGDSVYVYDVKPVLGRVWCYIGNGGWVSTKTMGYN